MATDTRTFGTFADDSGTGQNSWSNPSNASASDNSRASVTISIGNQQSHYLKATNSSHSSGSTLASGDTITQIKYRVERLKAGNPSANIRDYKIYPVEGGSIVTTTNFADTGTDWGTSDSTAEYTQTTNLPSAATILASDWGFVVACQNTNGTGSGQGQIDYVEAIITFTPALVVVPGTASLVLTTYAPTIRLDKIAKPPAASLTLTRYAPTIALTGGATVIPATAALTLTTYAPTIRLDKIVKPATAALVLTPFAPAARTGIAPTPATASLALTSFAPTVKTPRVARPGSAALTLTRYAPTVPIAREWQFQGMTWHES